LKYLEGESSASIIGGRASSAVFQICIWISLGRRGKSWNIVSPEVRAMLLPNGAMGRSAGISGFLLSTYFFFQELVMVYSLSLETRKILLRSRTVLGRIQR
jgi:hypothetical protein